MVALGRSTFVAGAASIAAAVGALWTYPHLTSADGATFAALYAGALLVVGLPLLWMEWAFGHSRNRALPAAFGPKWRHAAWVGLGGALLLAGILAAGAGWSARWAAAAFDPPLYDNAASMTRAVGGGADALLATALALVAAVPLIGGRAARLALPTGILALVVAAVVAASATGAQDARAALLDWTAPTRELVVRAVLQALLTIGAGVGAMAALASRRGDDRELATDAAYVLLAPATVVACLAFILVPSLDASGMSPMDDGRGDGGLFCLLPQALPGLGDARGGLVAGLTYGAFLLIALPAAAALLQPASDVLARGKDGWAPRFAAALLAYAAAVPVSFRAAWLTESVAAAVALLAAASLLMALHVATQRQASLAALRPVSPGLLRILGLSTHPAILAAAFVAATLWLLQESGAADLPASLARWIP